MAHSSTGPIRESTRRSDVMAIRSTCAGCACWRSALAAIVYHFTGIPSRSHICMNTNPTRIRVRARNRLLSLCWGFFTCVGLMLISGCERTQLNQRMEALCKQDGGSQVKETVTLPSTYFDAANRLILGPSFPLDAGKYFYRIGPDAYRIEFATDVIKAGEPTSKFFAEGRLVRYTTRVRRMSDAALLGTSIWYMRQGGEISLTGQSSISECPSPRPDIDNPVFKKGG